MKMPTSMKCRECGSWGGLWHDESCSGWLDKKAMEYMYKMRAKYENTIDDEPELKMEKVDKVKEKPLIVAECLDNIGMEEFFDVGVDYVVGGVVEDEGIIEVTDKTGGVRRVLASRFGKEKEEP